jgi:hypothetical protein
MYSIQVGWKCVDWINLVHFNSIQYKDKNLPVVKMVMEALGSIKCVEILSHLRNC